MRGRLRRRLFVWFGASIALTGVLAGALIWAASPAAQWRKHLSDLQTFVSGRFAEVWDDAPARDALGRAVADDLGVGVRLSDDVGRPLARFGASCERPYRVPIVRDGSSLGEAAFCAPTHGASPPMWIAFAVGAAVLWLASGYTAYRLLRPLSKLVAATHAIGAGNLDVKIDLGRDAYDEMQQLAVAMREMLARIRTQIDDQRELLAAVSHEIRTPLGHLRVLIELARESGSASPQLAEIEAEVLAIDRLVGQLVASSRVDFGTLDHRELDAVQLAVHALERANLDPTLLHASAERIPVPGDAALIGQALANLINNAVEHAGGVVELRVAEQDTTVRFEVNDEGPGLGDAPDDIFASFARGETRGGSLGLGLSLVRRIAQAHDGDAWVQSRPGGGASVGFDLPR